MQYKKLIIFTDGGARGNPGPAACGVVVLDDQHKVIGEYSKYLGETTNNQAEYQGVILALEKVKDLGALEIDFYLDSLLVVSQLSGEYKVKDKGLQSLFVKIWNSTQNYKKIKYHHIPRERNKQADKLVNLELDRHTS